ncbi:CD9 antigen isoform X2 [Centropristis striata]|uniref:CD9 antigen isoform X2 n=1 Tax=Centropristis striata TaxID=184440 RepID=UPI0027E1B9C1|nr:CD9 antigen isoform X2 [Centropristis striata]
MALDGCGLFCKYTLFIFNIIFAVVGFAFLGLGLWLRFSDGTRGIFEIEALNSTVFVTAVTVLIALGAVMLIVVIFGDYGACNEKRCSLQVFSVLLTILAMAEVVVGIMAYSNKDEVGRKIAEFYTSMYTLYGINGDPVIGATLTFIHTSLQCCGATGIVVVEVAKQTCPNQSFWTASCITTIVDVFNRKAPLVMGIFVGTGALLITALVCSIILLKQTKKNQQQMTAYYSTVY